MLIDGFQISEAVPLDDGSLVTTLIDTDGNTVGTVRRLTDGTATANMTSLESGSGGFDWSNVLGKVTQFLDDVAKSTQQAADQATRISRGIKGAQTGAAAGYNAPLRWQPWALAGAALAGVLIVGAVVSSSTRGRRR